MSEEQELADINLQYLLVGKDRQDEIMKQIAEEKEW